MPKNIDWEERYAEVRGAVEGFKRERGYWATVRELALASQAMIPVELGIEYVNGASP
jgi:hypothetical protein